MARLAGFEPATYGLEVNALPFIGNSIKFFKVQNICGLLFLKQLSRS